MRLGCGPARLSRFRVPRGVSIASSNSFRRAAILSTISAGCSSPAALRDSICRSRSSRPFRIQQTLSDLGGTDAYVHGEGPRKLLVALTDALVRVSKQPTVDELYRIFRRLSNESIDIRRSYGTLFGGRAFRDLVVLATGFVTRGMA